MLLLFHQKTDESSKENLNYTESWTSPPPPSFDKNPLRSRKEGWKSSSQSLNDCIETKYTAAVSQGSAKPTAENQT